MRSSTPCFHFGPFQLDPTEHLLLRRGQRVRIAPKLFETLLFLVQNAGRLVEKEVLIRAVWKDTFVEEGSLTHSVSVLRKILGQSSNGNRYIDTVPRHGYRFVAPVESIKGTPKRTALKGANVRPPALHSLAVLPLVNLSCNVNQDYFADGMTEALITGLAQIVPLRVISRTSVMRYRETRKPLPRIGEELDVDGIVEGTVFRAGKRVRITVQLLHAPTDRHLWATSYERGLRDVLTLQKDLAEAIAHEISRQLNCRRRPRRGMPRLHNTDAHEAYLKGRHCWNQRTEEGLNQSIGFYTEAISNDPGYALAYSGLADSYALLGSRRLGGVPPRELMVKAKDAASKALHLDQTLDEAHTALAFVRFQSDWDWAGAEREFRSAIDLNPNSATSRYRYAMYLATMSRVWEAMLEMKRAQELDPLSPIILTARGRLLHFQRKYDDAIEYHRKALAIDPSFVEAHFNLGMIYEWGDTTSSVSLVSDSRGNAYSPAGAMTTGTGLRQAIYYAKNIAAGSNTVTVTFNQAAVSPDVRILEYSGLDTSTPLDATAAAVGTGTTANSGYATTTSATELIFGAGTSGNIFSAAGTGFTKRIINIYRNIAEDKTVTGSGSYNATATNSSSNWVMQVATFRASRITRIRVHEVTSPVVGYRYATSTVGQGLTTSVVNSVSGPTSGVQLTKTAGGPQLVWISPPLAAAATISGTVTMNAWAKESVAACNCGMQVTLHKYSGGSVGSAFLNSERGTELGNSITQQNWTASPTSTSFSVGARIVIKWWINDAGGTMSSGRTVTTDYDGANEAADGDTWVQFTEILSFQPEPEIIQNKSEAVTGASSIDVTLNPVGAGHMVAVVVTADPPSTMVTSVTDNAAGGSCNYIEANALNVNSVTGGGLSDIWYCPNSKPGAFYFPATVSPATSGKLSIWAYEVSGLDTTSPLDVSGIASDPNNHSTYTGVSLTTSAATDFLVEANEGSC